MLAVQRVLWAMRCSGRNRRSHRHHHHQPAVAESPYLPERLPHRSGRWAPEAAPFSHVYVKDPRNRDFIWVRPGLFTLIDILFNASVLSAYWTAVASVDDRLFVDVIVFVSSTITIYHTAHTVFMFVQIQRHALARLSPLSVGTGLAVAAVAWLVAIASFLGERVFRRVIDAYSTVYDGSELTLVSIFYVLVLLLVASTSAAYAMGHNLAPLSRSTPPTPQVIHPPQASEERLL